MEKKSSETGNRKWNNHQEDPSDHKQFNEGFSAENLPPDYNDAEMQSETESDKYGNERHTERNRFPETDAAAMNSSADNATIHTGNRPTLRDTNYDNPERYPSSHPDQKYHRGNHNAG